MPLRIGTILPMPRFLSPEEERYARDFNEQHMIGTAYHQLCQRFGTDVANAAIRSRILRNRLQRELALRHGEPVVAVLSGDEYK